MESTDEQAMEDSESAIDRISMLPTEILHNILSLVRIRAVVRMRRLSKRWRQVCESLQFICLVHSEFERWEVKKFTRFVNNLLLLRAKADLHTFQLHWYGNSSLNCNDVMIWIGYAVKHSVKVLDLDLAYDHTFLPHCIFNCPSLQELNLQLGAPLYGHLGFVLPSAINLPSLKKLTLSDVEVSQVSLDQIIAQSPGLEDLNLQNCARYFKLIDSNVLKVLTLQGFKDGSGDRLTITAPCLIHFECMGCPLEDIYWTERPCLESARIETSGCTFDGQPEFTGISLHAKRLTKLTLYGLDVKVMLEKQLPTCSVFENLKDLYVGDWCLSDNLYIVLRFLQLSPRLEKLTIAHEKRSKATKVAGTDAVPINGMTIQCSLLETVVIRCCKNDGEVDKIVNAMVVNGVSSEKIHVTYYKDIVKRCLAEVKSQGQERQKELAILEKTLKEHPEWVDGSNYAESDSGNSEDYDSDNSEDNDSDNSEDDDDEMEDEDDNDEMEDEDDNDKTEDEDDDANSMEDDADNNEYDNDDL
ncbi:hypothetical protein ACP70R_036620 [Stipagrostis hirtigluma subsp. patula]